MINVSWTVDSIEVKPVVGSHENVVYNVQWRVIAREEHHVASSYGSVNLAFSEEDPFIPYEDLTEEQVINWVKQTLGPETVQSIENSATAELEKIKNPPTIMKPLPWV